MLEYIFYTDEGYCESPANKIVENFQVLGFEKGDSKAEALNAFLENNAWLKDYSYNVDKIIGCQIVR